MKYNKVRNYNFNNQRKIINKIRLEAIIRKAIRNGCDLQTVAISMAKEAYFQEIKCKFGIKVAYKSLQDIIIKAVDRESDLSLISESERLSWSNIFDLASVINEEDSLNLKSSLDYVSSTKQS